MTVTMMTYSLVQEQHTISKAMFAPQFFIAGFMYSLPFGVALRIWDSFLSRDFDFLYAVALAIFKVFEGAGGGIHLLSLSYSPRY